MFEAITCKFEISLIFVIDPMELTTVQPETKQIGIPGTSPEPHMLI
jgi:hypothetical protein